MSSPTSDPGQVGMSRGAMETLLARPILARLATSDRDRPRVIPMWFIWDETSVWMETSPDFPNARILRMNPRAALSIDETLGGLRFRAVIMRGTVEVIDSPAELVRDTVRRIYEKYLGADMAKEQPQAMLNSAQVLLRFTPARVVSWDDTASDTRGVEDQPY